VREFPLLEGGEIDRRLSLRPGSAERLARREKLPHVILPDGAIRFHWSDVTEVLKRITPPEDHKEETDE
jgi:hypothetical protein